jgi:hypothetical protein
MTVRFRVQQDANERMPTLPFVVPSQTNTTAHAPMIRLAYRRFIPVPTMGLKLRYAATRLQKGPMMYDQTAHNL